MSAPVIEQQSAPPPASTKWVPVGPGMAGIPTPVVNGQWIKGVGGAAVWSAIADSDVPSVGPGGRLNGNTSTSVVTDWNTVTATGWYTGVSAANGPGGNAAGGAPGWLLGMVVAHNPSWPTQEMWSFTEDPPRRWKRYMINGTWGVWRLLDAPWWNINAVSGYGAGIGDYGPPWGPGRVCKRDGLVICEGLISVPGLGAGGNAFTLPVDYRTTPGRNIIFNTAFGGGGAQLETWRINDTGAVTCSTGPTSWVSLSGVTFYADA